MEPTVVPVGWKRAIVKEKVVYMSPSGQLLQSTEAVQTYLSSDGTCKCGLECPIILDKVFNFDPRVFCKPRTAQEASNDNGLTNLCNHKRKVVAMATWLDSVETTKVEDNVTANKPGPSKSKPISNFATEMQFPNFPSSNMLPNSMHPGTMPQMNQMNLMHHIDSIPFDAHMQRNTIEAQQHQMRMLYEFHQQFGTNLKQRKTKNQGEFFAGNQLGNQQMQQQMPFPGHSVPGMSPPRFANPGMPRFPHQRFPFPGEFNQQQHPGPMANLHPGAIPRGMPQGMPQGMMSPPMGNMFPRAQHPHAANNPQMCMPGMFGEDVSMYMTGPTSPTFPRMRHPGVRPKKKRARSADQVKVPTTCSPIQHVLCESDTRSMSASNLLSIAARAQLANKQQQEAVCKMPNLASQLLQLPHGELTKMIKAHQEQAKRDSSEKSEQLSINHVINQVQAGPTDNPSDNSETRKSGVTNVQESQSEVDGDGEVNHQDDEKKTAENPPEGKESLCEPQRKDVFVEQEKFHDSGSFKTHSSPSHAKCVSQTSESTVGSPGTLVKEVEDESTKNQTMPEEPTKCEKSEEGKDGSLEVQSSKPNHPMEHVLNEEELHRLKMEQQYYHALPGNVQQPLRDGYPVDMMPGVPPGMPVPPGHVVPRMPGIPEIGPMGYPPVPWGGLQNPTFAMHETELDFAPSKKRKRKAKNQRSVSADGLLAHGGMLPHRQMPQMMPFHSSGQPAMSQMVMRNPHMNPPLHNPVQTNQIHEYTPAPHIPGMVRPPFPDQQLVSGTHMHVPQLEQQNINSLPVIVQSALEDAQLRNILPQLQQQRLYMKSTGPKKVKDMLADLRNSNQTAVTSANSDTSSQDVSAITQTISETMNTPSGVPVSQAVGILEQTVSKDSSQAIIELDPLFSLPRDSVKTHNAEDNEPLNTMHCSNSADPLSDGQNLSGLAASEPSNEQYSSTLGDLQSEDTHMVEHPVEQDQTFDNSKDSLNNLDVHVYVGHDESVIHSAPGDNVEDAQCVSREPVSEAAETSVEVPKESSEASGNAIKITCPTSPTDKAPEVHQVQEFGSATTSSMPSVSEEQEVATALLSMTDQPLKSPFHNSSETCLRKDKLAINPAADISKCEGTVKTLESSRQLNNNVSSTVKEQSNDEVISEVTYSLPVTGKDASSDQVARVEESGSNCCTVDEVTINIERDASSSTVALQDQMLRLENTDFNVQEIENTDKEFNISRNSNALPMEAACEDKAKYSPHSQGDCSTLCLKVHESIQDSSCAENSDLSSQADAEDSSKGHTPGTDSVMSGIQLSSEAVKENASQVEGQCATDTETVEGGKELDDFEKEKETDSEHRTTVENSGLDNQLRTDLKCEMRNAKELCDVEEKCARGSSEGSEGVSSENVDSNERTVERLSPECNVNSNNSNSSDHLIPSDEVCDVDLNSNMKPMEAISDTSDSCVDNVVCDASVIDIAGESEMQSTCEESVPMEVFEQVPITSGKYDVDTLSDLCEDSESTSPSAPCGLDNELNIEGASDQVQESTAFPSEGADKDVSDAAASSADLLEDVPRSKNKTESREPQMRPDLKQDNTSVQDVKPESKCQAIKDGCGGGGRLALRDSSVNNIQEVVPVSEQIKKPADQCDSVTSAMDRSTDNGIVGDEASCSPNHDEESSFSPEVETGDLVWGQIRGYSSWPGKVVSDRDVKGQKKKEDGKVWVMWFGDHSFTQVEPTKLKTLTEGLEAHHKARTRHRTRHRTLTSSLEAAIQEAMMELDKKTEQANEKKRKTAARGRSRLKRQKIR